MTDRIQELAEQANLCFVNHDDRLTSHFSTFADMEDEVKIFTNLILRDCFQQLFAEVKDQSGQQLYDRVVAATNQHFGIKQ